MAENTDNIDILSAAGLTITGSSAPIDPELQKLLAETIKITHERLVQERREKAQNTADYEAFDKQERTRITATPSRARVYALSGMDAYKPGSEVDINDVLANLESYFGAKSDPRLANKLSKDSFTAYRFAQSKARERGLIR